MKRFEVHSTEDLVKMTPTFEYADLTLEEKKEVVKGVIDIMKHTLSKLEIAASKESA